MIRWMRITFGVFPERIVRNVENGYVLVSHIRVLILKRLGLETSLTMIPKTLNSHGKRFWISENRLLKSWSGN